MFFPNLYRALMFRFSSLVWRGISKGFSQDCSVAVHSSTVLARSSAKWQESWITKWRQGGCTAVLNCNISHWDTLDALNTTANQRTHNAGTFNLNLMDISETLWAFICWWSSQTRVSRKNSRGYIIEEKREKENSGFNNDILLMFRHRTCFEQIHYSLSTNQQTND